ncbi:hypothetical protein Vca1114GL_04742 [Vibrio campbellii]|uniref:hypothetical protein n=1 Tax=Vibrio campbellii TaxID=680 RepID=UPI00097FA7CA|nr:hypothetical protein [Vibrio campbellii]AQM71159.1 hypothetical protein Vca1114GL_04742 [Vibrio campbellii]
METDKLIKIIEPKIITSNDDYWAMHACSFLEYFYEHTYSEINFSRLEKRNLPLTMASLKSESSANFISDMRRYFKNWGFQYLLVHFLRTEQGENHVLELLTYLSDIHDIDLSDGLVKYGWFVTGSDSRSGKRFIGREHIPLLGSEHVSLGDYRKAKDTDLCFRLIYEDENPRTGDMEESSIAVLGEVEGKYSSDIHRSSYWNRKPKLSQFGIGVSTKIDNNQIEVVRSDNGRKVVITMSSRDHVVHDFIDMLDVFDWVLYRRFNRDRIPRSYIEMGMRNTIEYLIESMHTPVYKVIEELRKFIKIADEAEDETNDITMPSVPTIIT